MPKYWPSCHQSNVDYKKIRKKDITNFTRNLNLLGIYHLAMHLQPLFKFFFLYSSFNFKDNFGEVNINFFFVFSKQKQTFTIFEIFSHEYFLFLFRSMDPTLKKKLSKNCNPQKIEFCCQVSICFLKVLAKLLMKDDQFDN